LLRLLQTLYARQIGLRNLAVLYYRIINTTNRLWLREKNRLWELWTGKSLITARSIILVSMDASGLWSSKWDVFVRPPSTGGTVYTLQQSAHDDVRPCSCARETVVTVINTAYHSAFVACS